MLNKIKKLLVILVILSISSSYTVIATKEKESNDGPELKVGVFGASLLSPKKSGFIIYNNGDEPINDIYYTFSIKSISSDVINISYSDELDQLKVNSAFVNVYPNVNNGFGLVTLSINVNSSNAGEAIETIYGFQIGSIIISKGYLLAWY